MQIMHMMNRNVTHPVFAEKRSSMKEFVETFNKNYDFLYENGDEKIAGYNEALETGDKLIAEEYTEAFMRAFIQEREDYISSDRETAALAFTMEDFGLLDKIDKIQQKYEQILKAISTRSDLSDNEKVENKLQAEEGFKQEQASVFDNIIQNTELFKNPELKEQFIEKADKIEKMLNDDFITESEADFLLSNIRKEITEKNLSKELA